MIAALPLLLAIYAPAPCTVEIIERDGRPVIIIDGSSLWGECARLWRA
jgi:hypothetical protein